MKLRQCVLIAWVVLIPTVARANDFGVLRTAVPVEKSVWRLGGGGVVSLEDDGREAFMLLASTGLGPKADAELKWSMSGDDMAIGGGINFLVLKAGDFPVDMSVGAGYHYVNHDANDVNSVDLSAIVSKPINPKVSVFGALSLAFASADVPEGFDGSTTNVHIVPGIDFKLNEKLNIVAEIGIGFDNAQNYIAGVIHYYIR